MCLPHLLLAAIATGIGGAMKAAGQSQADHAMTNTFMAERQRQQDFENQQMADFNGSLDSTKNTVLDPNAQAAAAGKRNAQYTAATAPATGAYLPGSSSAPQVVADGKASAAATADAHTSSLGRTLANLGGMDDLMQQNNTNVLHNSQDIAKIGGFRAGSMNALQPEMTAASRKGSTLKMLGGLAQQIGMMAAGAPGGGGFSPLPVGVAGQTVLPAITGVPDLASLSASLPGMAI